MERIITIWHPGIAPWTGASLLCDTKAFEDKTHFPSANASQPEERASFFKADSCHLYQIPRLLRHGLEQGTNRLYKRYL
jgi:hypothetical protein